MTRQRVDTPTLQGEMLTLRPIRVDDAQALWESVSDPEGMRLTGTTRRFTLEEARDWCANVGELPGRVDLAITLVGHDEYLGEIVLDDIDEHLQSASLRLAMRPGYRGRGYGTEAIELVLGFAFDGLGLHRVGLDVLAINPRAQALYENLGFRVEGRRRDAYRDGERWCDAIDMGLLEDEYRAGQFGDATR